VADDPNNQIYLTYKTRMLAEARCKFRARFWNVMVAWYSLWLIALSVIDLKSPEGKGHALAIVVLSIFVFSLSLIIPSIGLDEKAVRHRECYLRLQRLRAEKLSETAKLQRYFDILEGYPNHSDIEWDATVVRANMRGQSLVNNSGPIVATKTQYAKVYGESLFVAATYIVITALPVLALIYISRLG
jgi:hypothetical protein